MTYNLYLPPAFLMMAGAFILPFVNKKLRSSLFLLFPLLSLSMVIMLPEGSFLQTSLAGLPLVLCKVDSLSRVFGIIFSFIAFAGGLYAFHIKDTGQQIATLLYAGGALGVTFAGDFFTFFIFWESMAVASTYLVWARRTRESSRAGFRYLIYHVFGGGVLFAGILLHFAETKSLAIGKLAANGSPASWLILIGVAVNAAIPPLSAWLSDAYPKATVTGAVFMSAFTTKSAVYALARMFAGWEILLIGGVIMALYGVVFAVLANDIRGILAYHIISQVGYMVAGVGIGTEMAINGTTAHAFCHILYKSLLFMGAGVVLHTTGKSKLTELGGLGKKQPLTLWLYMIGAFSISGFPLFNGFISKSMVIAAAGESHYNVYMLLLLLASVGTFLHTGLKLPYFTWYGKDRGLKPEKPPKNMHVGMAVVAFGCTLLGVAPKLLYNILPYTVHFQPYTIPHLVETTQILVFTFIGFWVLRIKLAGEAKITLDTDWFYRRPAKLARIALVNSVDDLFNKAETMAFSIARKLIAFGKNPYQIFQRTKAQAYTPDRYRPPAQLLVFSILGLFILFTLAGLLFKHL